MTDESGHPLYTALLYLCLPVILARLLWRSRTNPAYRRRWPERFGFGPPATEARVWIHAVSVGEVNAAAPLIRRIQAEFARAPLLLTTTTPTGSQQAARLFGDSVLHQYLPYDTPDAMGRLLERYHPQVAVIMETELWPNLTALCARRGIALLLANGRLSDRSLRGYRRFRGISRRCLVRFQAILAQSHDDAARFRELGATTVTVAGNMKFDAGDPNKPGTAQEYRAAFGLGDRPVWVAGSTHAGEESLLIDVHRQVLVRHPDALLIIAPRHPERFGEVAALLDQRGLSYQRRSGSRACRQTDAVLLADTMGELPVLYALGRVAFVGGSLAAAGGHNLLEPLRAGVPVLFGPHMENFRDIERLTLDYGAGEQVETGEKLAQRLESYLTDPRLCRERVHNATRLLDDCRGATEITFAALCRALGESGARTAGTAAGMAR